MRLGGRHDSEIISSAATATIILFAIWPSKGRSWMKRWGHEESRPEPELEV